MLVTPIDEVAGAVAYTSKPAVVDGEKAVEAALAEGLFPIIDKSVDVFAVPSAEGTCIHGLYTEGQACKLFSLVQPTCKLFASKPFNRFINCPA